MEKESLKIKMKKDSESWSLKKFLSKFSGKKDVNTEQHEKIGALRERIENQNKNNCPTGILFYIATGRQCPRPVNPWYDTIKEMADKANFHFGGFHRAVIYGLYPELKSACEYFSDQVGKELRHRKQLSNDDLMEIENKTIERFSLPKSLSITEINEEQQKRINANKAVAMEEYVKQETKQFFPAVQALANSLRKSIPDGERNDLEFVKQFNTISCCLYNEEFFNEKKSILNPEIAKTVEQLFELRKSGVLSEDFKIKKYSEFRKSALVTDLTYKGKSYNVDKNMVSRLSAFGIRREI